MKPLRLLFILFFVLFIVGTGYLVWWNLVGLKNETRAATAYTPANAEKLMSIVNDWRYSQGLQPYTKDERLCTFASTRVFELQSDFSHKGFDDRAAKYKFDFQFEKLAENIVEGFTESQALVEWLKSPTHKEALEFPYQYSCIKCLNNRCAQIFANF